MKTLEEMIRELPPEYRKEVEDFVKFLLEKRTKKPKDKFRFDWEGALQDWRDQYTSVELQHRALEWGGLMCLIDTNLIMEKFGIYSVIP